MEEAKLLAKEYTKALDSAKKAEDKLIGALIKYLLANSFWPKMCTETAIAESLNMPKSVIRRMLAKLCNEWIITTEDWGTVKPYDVALLGAALDRGYLSLGREEMSKILGVGEVDASKARPSRGSPSVYADVGGRSVVRFLGPGQKKAYRSLVLRFFWYLPQTGFEDAFKEAFPEELVSRLGALAPEKSLLEEVSALSRVVDAFWYVSDYEELEEADPEKIRQLALARVENRIRFVISRLRIFESLVKEKGYEAVERDLSSRKGCPVDRIQNEDGEVEGEEKFRKEYLYGTTLALRNGCRFAETLGVDKTLLQEAEELCRSLEKLAEKANRP